MWNKERLRKGLLAVSLSALILTLGGCPFDDDDDSDDPMVEAPADEAPTDEAPTDEAPADEAPALGISKIDFGLEDLVEPTWGPAATVTAFAPGQASYEFLNGADHTGDMGANCSGCHSGANDSIPPLASASRDLAGPLAVPFPAENEQVEITLQAAYDADHFYLRAQWDTAGTVGITHGTYAFDGTEWVRNAEGNAPGATLEDGEVFNREDRISLMFMPASNDISAGDSFHTAGCFTACHEDSADMPEEADSTQTSKYLYSAAHEGNYTSGTETNAEVQDGTTDNYPDMWHWRGARSAIANTLTDGFVMQTRANDDSPNYYNSQDPNDAPNAFMYDKAWLSAWIVEHFPDFDGETERHVIPAALWEQVEQAPTLVPGLNAVEFDAALANLEEGDVLPRRWVDTGDIATDGTKSRTDVEAFSAWDNGTWTVVFKRARDTGNEDDHALNPNLEEYSMAFAIHQLNTGGRWHQVTFPVTLGPAGSGADIEANDL